MATSAYCKAATGTNRRLVGRAKRFAKPFVFTTATNGCGFARQIASGFCLIERLLQAFFRLDTHETFHDLAAFENH